MTTPSKFNALLSLLDDPDTQVYHQVKNELIDLGQSVVPLLEDAWESSFDHLLQERIEGIIHSIQVDEVQRKLAAWKKQEHSTLLEGAIIVAQYQYPDLDIDKIHDFVAQLTQDVWLEMNVEYTAMEKAGVINKVFFDIYGFSGNKKNFHSPRNSFINNVLDSRKGSPISLSILYLEVAKRLKIPVYGVNLPEHFILAYADLPLPFGDANDPNNILFYINLFNKGSFFQFADIEQFLKQLKVDLQPDFYLPCDDVTIIKRLLNNLIFCYHKAAYEDKVEDLKRIRKSLE